MSYATIDDLRKRLSETKLQQLTDFDNTGSADSGRVSTALEFAAAMIDSYAGGRYTLPLTASNQVKDLELQIALYKLYEGRQQITETIRTSYEDARAFLRDVSTGKASLDQAASLQTSAMDVVTRDHSTDPYGFDDARLEDFIG